MWLPMYELHRLCLLLKHSTNKRYRAKIQAQISQSMTTIPSTFSTAIKSQVWVYLSWNTGNFVYYFRSTPILRLKKPMPTALELNENGKRKP